jgi:HK97 family phage prohead protease
MIEVETRYTPGQVEVRSFAAEFAAERRTIGGYAAKFNKSSGNLGGFTERVAPTAFNRSRGNGFPDVRARYNHNDNMLLGTTNSRTLRLDIDEVGLVYDVDVPESRADVYELVLRGDVNKSSFAFRVRGADGGDDWGLSEDGEGDEWGLSDQNYPQRTLLSVDLIDVAPVSIPPAYPDTSSGLRSLARHMEAEFEEVRALAETGDLRKFFIRTDNTGKPAKPKTYGAAARMALLGRKSDPLA